MGLSWLRVSLAATAIAAFGGTVVYLGGGLADDSHAASTGDSASSSTANARTSAKPKAAAKQSSARRSRGS
jgi:hypothetical protein